MSAPGRNDPCPCGSGKKYKKCCMVQAAAQFVIGQSAPGPSPEFLSAPTASDGLRSRAVNATNVAPPSEMLMRAVALHQEGKLAEAEAIYRMLLRGDPSDSHALHYLGLIALQQERYADAIGLIEKAIAADPLIPSFHCNLGNAYNGLWQYDASIAAYNAAVRLDPQFLAAWVNLGNAHRDKNDADAAIAAYQQALSVDPAYIPAHVNLAAVLFNEGRLQEAQQHRDLAYGRQCVFATRSATATCTVLLLCDAGKGNVPLNFLFPLHANNQIEWMIEYAAADQYLNLPPYDLVFNAIGDPDVSGPTVEAVEKFLNVCEKPLLNPPAAVARTARFLMPELLKDIHGAYIPPAWLVEPEGAWYASPLFRFPVLVRPFSSHGGKGLTLVENREALAQMQPQGSMHICGYHDYRSADGFYRKYRVIFVDRTPYPYHLAISQNWMVHYLSADMPAHPWKLEEERRFLEDPAGVLGEHGMAALAEIGRRLDLDYAGVDFSVLPDGRLLIFEANATMLAHPEKVIAALKFKNPYIQRIFDAFDALLQRTVRR
jgi:Flp pilus assembly protein TadD